MLEMIRTQILIFKNKMSVIESSDLSVFFFLLIWLHCLHLQQS